MYIRRLVSFQMHTNQVFNGLRLIETSTQSLLHPEGGGVTPTKFGWGCAARFPYPIYDQTLRYWSLPYLWPERFIKILFHTCVIIESLVQTNVKLP